MERTKTMIWSYKVQKYNVPIDYTLTASSRKRSVSVSESFFFSAVSFPLRNGERCCGAFPFARRSSWGRLGNAVTEFILTHTAVESICWHIHSPHKVPARNVLRLPFPIELPEPRPVGGNRFPSRVLALSLDEKARLTWTRTTDNKNVLVRR